MWMKLDSHFPISATFGIIFSGLARRYWCWIASSLGRLLFVRWFFIGFTFLRFSVFEVGQQVVFRMVFCDGRIAEGWLAGLSKQQFVIVVALGLLYLRSCSPFLMLPSQF